MDGEKNELFFLGKERELTMNLGRSLSGSWWWCWMFWWILYEMFQCVCCTTNIFFLGDSMTTYGFRWEWIYVLIRFRNMWDVDWMIALGYSTDELRYRVDWYWLRLKMRLNLTKHCTFCCCWFWRISNYKINLWYWWIPMFTWCFCGSPSCQLKF